MPSFLTSGFLNLSIEIPFVTATSSQLVSSTNGKATNSSQKNYSNNAEGN
jgi:hypothetical protein